MHIDFILDIGCLWSYIAWRNLQTALKSFPAPVEITPFFIPPFSFFPAVSINPAVRARLSRDKAGPLLRRSGINVPFDELPDLPEDVSPPCRMIRHAFCRQKGGKVLSDVFDAFFLSAQNICDTAVLTRIARKNGLPDDCFTLPCPAVLPDAPAKEPLKAVPCLIFDRKTMIAGAQSVECLKNMLSLAFRLREETDSE